MDIPALSVAMAQANITNQLGTAMLSNALEMAEGNGDSMVRMMENSVTPEIGGNIDVSV
ncbi:MAG: YjfB family protein [Lachnospiraceae bacterium]|nr:YjfB family protein [Lachnospiraceae bacterium]